MMGSWAAGGGGWHGRAWPWPRSSPSCSDWSSRRRSSHGCGPGWWCRSSACGASISAATGLDYNLLTRRATLTGVSLSAEGHAADPVFAARRVSVEVPWAAYAGTLRLSSLVIDDGVVTLVRERGQIVNLPPSSGRPPPEVPRHLDLRGLTARNLTVNYVDRTGDIEVGVRGLNIELSEIRDRAWHQRRRHHRGRERAGPGRRAGHRQPAGEGAHRLRRQPRDPRSPDRAVPRGHGDRQRPGQPRARRHLVRPDPRGHARHGAAGRVGAAPGAGVGGGHLHRHDDRPARPQRDPAGVPRAGAGRRPGPPACRSTATSRSPSARALVERFRLVAPGPARAADRPGTIEGTAQYTFGAGAIELQAAFRDLDLDLALAFNDQEPLDIAAWEDGTVTLSRAGRDAPRRIRAAGRSSPLARRDRIALDGRWDAALQDGQLGRRPRSPLARHGAGLGHRPLARRDRPGARAAQRPAGGRGRRRWAGRARGTAVRASTCRRRSRASVGRCRPASSSAGRSMTRSCAAAPSPPR